MPQDNINSTLQNVAVNLSIIARSDVNAFPPATSTTSVQSTGVTVGNDPVVLVAPNTERHGIAFQNFNRSDAAVIYIFPTNNDAISTTSLAGSIMVQNEMLVFPSSLYPNINCGWSAVAIGLTLPAPFTVFEFF